MKNGQPGFGKSHIMNRIAGVPARPSWMPAWLHRWRERRAWQRYAKKTGVTMVDFKCYDIAIGDIAMPVPRAWGEDFKEFTQLGETLPDWREFKKE